jgi:hypothetical protein
MEIPLAKIVAATSPPFRPHAYRIEEEGSERLEGAG